MLFIGDDWAEAHHDIEIVDETGRRLAKRRLPEGIDGLAGLHALIADHLPEDGEPAEVLVGIKTDRGPWVQALIASGHPVYAVNPLQVVRYRERHGSPAPRATPGTPTPWPSWFASTGPITGRWPGTPSWPST